MWFVAGVLAAAAMAAYLALVPLTRSLGPDASLPPALTIASSDQAAVGLASTDFKDSGGSSTFVRALPKKVKAKPPVVAAQSTGEPRSATVLVNVGSAPAPSASSSGGATPPSTPPSTPPARKSGGSINGAGETVSGDALASSGGTADDGPAIEVGSTGEPAP